MNWLLLTSIDPVVRNQHAIHLDNIIDATIGRQDCVYLISGSCTYKHPDYTPNWCTATILGPKTLSSSIENNDIMPIDFSNLIHMVCGPKRKMYKRLQSDPRRMASIFAGKLKSRSQQLEQHIEWFKHIMSTVRRHRIKKILIIDDPVFIYMILFVYHITVDINKQSVSLSRLFNEVELNIIYLDPKNSSNSNGNSSDVSGNCDGSSDVCSAEYWQLAIAELQRIASIHPTWRQIHCLDTTTMPIPQLQSNAKKIQDILDTFILNTQQLLKDDQSRIPHCISLDIPIILAHAESIISNIITQEVSRVIECMTHQLIIMITGDNSSYGDNNNNNNSSYAYDNKAIYMSRLAHQLELQISIDWYTIDCHGYPEGIIPCIIPESELDILQKNMLTASMLFKTQTCQYGAFSLVFKLGDIITHTAISHSYNNKHRVDGILPLLSPINMLY